MKLSSKYLSTFQYIQMPTPEEAAEISEEIFAKTGFPHVMGLVDGTHIEILKPSKSKSNLYVSGSQPPGRVPEPGLGDSLIGTYNSLIGTYKTIEIKNVFENA